MKKLFAVLALGMFMAGGIMGCEASAKVGDNDSDPGRTTVKKTTVVQPDGDRTTKTEVRHDVNP